MPDDPTDHAVAQTTQWCWRPLANCSGKVSHRPEKQATISDMLLLSRVRGRDENSHLMRVDTVREPRETSQRTKENAADHVVVTYSDEVPEHRPRTNDHEVARAE